MPTRFYFPSTGTPGASPAFDGSWEQTSDAIRLPTFTTKQNTSQVVQSGSTTTNSSGSFDVLLGQFISEPLAAQTITGTVSGVIKARETNNAADLRVQLLIKVVSKDGSTLRGTLLAHDTGTLASEFSNSTTQWFSRLLPVAGRSNTLSSVAVQAEDRIVIEIGFRTHKTNTTAYTGRLAFEDNLADLALSDTDSTLGTPWLEFSQNINFFTPPASHTVTLGNWRWYTDAATDGALAAIASENTTPNLTSGQMQNAILRLRLQLHETGGQAGSGVVALNYREAAATFTPVQEQIVASNKQGVWFRYANGLAAAGASVGSLLLTGSTQAGKYHEAGNVSVSVAASGRTETDVALLIHWPPPDSTVTFQVTYDGAAIGEITLNTSGVADRPYSITRLDGDTSQKTTREIRFAAWRRLYYAHGRWWFFTVQYNTPTELAYYTWTGTGAWSAKQSVTFGASGHQSLHALAFKEIGGVHVAHVQFTNSSSTRRGRRGVLNSDGTITWASEWTLAQNSDRHRHIALDDNNHVWIGGTTASTGVWARRSTGADTGASWTAAWDAALTASDTGVVSGNIFALQSIGTDKVLAVWQSGNNLKWATATPSGFSAVANVNTTTNAGPEDWGLVRIGGFVYLIHTDATGAGGNWILRVYNIATDTWTTGTSPGVSGQPTSNDGIPLTAHGNSLYAFGTFANPEGGQDRSVRYKQYTFAPGSEASGTWGTLTDLTPPESRGNGDHMSTPDVTANGQLPLVFAFNDDDVSGNARTAEYHVLSVAPPPPTIAIENSTSATNSGSNTTGTLPAGTVAGNALVAHWTVQSSLADAAMVLPDGWTQAAFVKTSTNPSTKVAYRICDGTEPASWVFPSGSNVNASVSITRLSGDINASTFFDVTPTTNHSGSGTSDQLTTPGQTTTTGSALLLWCAAVIAAGGTITAPAGMTEQVEHTTGVRQEVAYEVRPTAGATGSRDGSITTATRWTTVLLALRPAIGGAYALPADAGAYLLAGQDADLRSARLMGADSGAYLLAGQDAGLNHSAAGAGALLLATGGYLRLATGGKFLLADGSTAISYSISMDAGSFTLDGIDAGLLATRLLTADGTTYALAGQSANLLHGRLLAAAAGTYTLTGQDAALLSARLLVAAASTYTLAGQDVNLLAARLIGAAAGSYALTGQDAALIYSALTHYLLEASQGAYSLTGQQAGLLATRLLAAAQGAYALTSNDAALVYQQVGAYVLGALAGNYNVAGQDAGLLFARLMAAAQGSYTLVGQSANTLVGRLVQAAQGAFTLTGLDAALVYTPAAGYLMPAATGTYALSGQDAGLLAARILGADARAYAVTGQDAALLRGFAIGAASGAYSVTGEEAAFALARVLQAEQGGYTLNGKLVRFVYSGTPSGKYVYVVPVDNRIYVVVAPATTPDDRTVTVKSEQSPVTV